MKLIPIQINDDGEIELVMPDTIVENGDVLVTGDGVHLPVLGVSGGTVIDRLDIIEEWIDAHDKQNVTIAAPEIKIYD